MGADIKSLRIRIRSVESTMHLTKAMGLVASSKIRKATARMEKSRFYRSVMLDAFAEEYRDAAAAKLYFNTDNPLVQRMMTVGDSD